MFKLPFDKWTLRFYSEEHEIQYQEDQKEYRLLCLKLYNVTLFFICLVTVLMFIAQEQPSTVIYILSGLTAFNFINIFLGKLVQKRLRIVFTSHFIFHIPVTIFIANNGQVPLFIQGYAVGALFIFLAQNLENRVKLLCISATPLLFFGVFNIYDLSLLQYVTFTLFCVALSGFQLHHNEYNKRLLFSLKQINEKQKDLIYEFAKDGLILMSLDKRSRQFELEFQNKQIETEFNIQNTTTLKEFLRDVKINNDTSVRNSHDFKQPLMTDTTLEQRLFTILNKEQGNINVNNSQNYIYCELQKENAYHSYHINVRKINLGKLMLLVQIIKDQTHQLNDQYDDQLQQIKRTVAEEIWKIAKELNNHVKEINKFTYSQSALNCVFSVINQMKNLTLHLQSEKIEMLRNQIQQISLRDLINQVYPYLVFRAKKMKILLKLLNQVNNNFVVHINTKFFIQILINVFELTVKQATIKRLKACNMFWIIELENNLNPLGDQLVQRDFSKSQQSQQLLKLAFHYRLDIQNQQSDTSMQEKVTNKLLQVVGPYNRIVNCMSNLSDVEASLHPFNLICTYFYIYTDQSKLDLSFTTQICQHIV